MPFNRENSMEMMYSMGLDIHFYATVILFGVILFNLFRLLRATNIHHYAKKSVYINQLAMLFLGAVVFTGMIMMAAKHLDFTLENIVMTLFALLFFILEARRLKQLRFLDITQENPLQDYQTRAKKLLYIELMGTVLISAWMLLI